MTPRPPWRNPPGDIGSWQAGQSLFIYGEKLKPGNQITGPAVILRPDTTILVEDTDKPRTDPYLNLIITVGQYE